MARHLLQSGTILTVFSAFNGKAPRISFKSVVDWLMCFQDRANQRRDLSELSECQLADIGVTRREAAREAGKWFWE
jgi:uncharacterized protein YjiS (DUF1127 family)